MWMLSGDESRPMHDACRLMGEVLYVSSRSRKNTELPKQQRSVEIDPLAGNSLFGIKVKDSASRHLKFSVGGRYAVPGAGMRAAKGHFNDDALAAHVLLCNVRRDIREASSSCESEPVVQCADALSVIELGSIQDESRVLSKGGKNRVEIMLVFGLHVFLDEPPAGFKPILVRSYGHRVLALNESRRSGS
jgi:hypothetical protein